MSSPNRRARPVVLAVLDGLAGRDDHGSDGLPSARTPVLSALERLRPRGLVMTSGPDVGFRSPIDCAIRAGRFADNDVIRRVIAQARDMGGRLHLIGLVSEGGVHSSLDHLYALIEAAKKARVRVVVHAFLDGRDVAPRAAARNIAEVESKLAGGVGRIGTVSGRAWAMDCNDRWDRVQQCYRAILAAEVQRADSALGGLEQSYDAGKTDEVVEPFVVFDYPGVSPVDVAIHFNLRPEGARALTLALASPRFDAFPRKGGRAPFAGRYASLTTHDDASGLPVAWPGEPRANLLPELLANAGYRQFRWTDAACSTRVAEDAIRSGEYDLVLVHFASPHPAENSGPSEAPTVDAGLGTLVEAARSVGGAALVVGGPGGVERAEDPEPRSPHEAGTSSSAWLLYVNDADRSARIREGARLGDIVPTLLELLELPVPTEMTGRSLLCR